MQLRAFDAGMGRRGQMTSAALGVSVLRRTLGGCPDIGHRGQRRDRWPRQTIT